MKKRKKLRHYIEQELTTVTCTSKVSLHTWILKINLKQQTAVHSLIIMVITL